MKKIKVLRIIARLNIGGPAIHTALLTKELSDDYFESVLMCGSVSKNEGDMGYVVKSYDVNPVYIRSLRREINPFHDAAALYRMMRFMHKFKPDIVHTHTAKAGALGRIAAALMFVPVKIHTFHGNIFHGYFGNKKARLFLFIERILAKFSDVIVAISPSQKDDVINKYRITNPEKCRVVKLGFDLDRFLRDPEKQSAFRIRLKIKEDDILVGIVGRLVPIKNHKMFVNAADHVIKHAPARLRNKIKFAIVGDGQERQEIQAYVKFKKLESVVLFTGWETNTVDVCAGLDIIALTSLNEGTPVSLIEAMTASRPVVATDVGGVRDVVGDAGIIVKSGDYRVMAKEILGLAMSSEIRSRLGARGCELVKNTYGKARLVSELRELYEETLTRRKKKKGKAE